VAGPSLPATGPSRRAVEVNGAKRRPPRWSGPPRGAAARV